MNEFRAKMNENGRIVIPAGARKMLNIKAGDNLVLQVKNGELVLTPIALQLKRAQELFQKVTKGKKNIVDEFIKERREEAKREK